MEFQTQVKPDPNALTWRDVADLGLDAMPADMADADDDQEG